MKLQGAGKIIKNSPFKWKDMGEDLENFSEKVINVVCEYLKPSKLSDVEDFKHGRGNYRFLPDFTECADKGKDFLINCIDSLKGVGQNSSGIQYDTLYYGNMSEAFTPFFNPDTFSYVNAIPTESLLTHSLDITNIDTTIADIISSFPDTEVYTSVIGDSLLNVDIPDVVPWVETGSSSGRFLDSAGEVIGDIAEGIGDILSDAGEFIIENGLSILGAIFGF